VIGYNQFTSNALHMCVIKSVAPFAMRVSCWAVVRTGE